jgi:hypothetical protein
LQVDQARRLKELVQENAKLKRLVGELSLERLVLKPRRHGNRGDCPWCKAEAENEAAEKLADLQEREASTYISADG